jgi:DNA-binding transcriptional LysR family regulator
VAGGIDVALRIADLPDSSLIARRLCPVERWVVGTTGYFARRGTPQRPRDLENHACLGYSYLMSGETWRFKDSPGAEEVVNVNARLNANNAEALCASLEASEGIAAPAGLHCLAGSQGRASHPRPERMGYAVPGTQPRDACRRPRAIRIRALLDSSRSVLRPARRHGPSKQGTKRVLFDKYRLG